MITVSSVQLTNSAVIRISKVSGCLQLVEIREIWCNLKWCKETLEILWNLTDVPEINICKSRTLCYSVSLLTGLLLRLFST